MIDIPIKKNYVQYPFPKTALYKHDTNEYGPDGWILVPKETMVIGEDDTCFVEKIYITENHGTEPDLPVGAKFKATIGFHKSRLIKFLDTQLSLFETAGL